MEIHGRVQNGVVVLEGEMTLADGTPVLVVPCGKVVIRVPKKQRRVTLPLVRTGRPGSIDLTPERAAELLEEDDLASRR